MDLSCKVLLAGKLKRPMLVPLSVCVCVGGAHNMNGIYVKVGSVKGLKVAQPNTGDLLSQAVNGGWGGGLRGLGGSRVGEGLCAL